MSSFPGQGFALVAENTTGESIQPGAPPNKSARTKLRLRNEEPPLPTVEIEQLLELGMALGHKRFEIASLAGRDADGIVAAHAWAEARGGEAELVPSKRQTKTNALGSPSYYDRPAFGLDGREERRREVAWLRERVDNLSRELMLARKDSSRLAKLLKEEEGVGREQRRRAEEAIKEANVLKEELGRLKQAQSSHSLAARSALSDAHDRSVRMAERRRRQQAESLMQAYKSLYEDQLQTQYASKDSYRSLTKGYSRLVADNKALRREIAVSTAIPSGHSPSPVTAEISAETLAQNVGRRSNETETVPESDDRKNNATKEPMVAKSASDALLAGAVAESAAEVESLSHSKISTAKEHEQECEPASEGEINPIGTSTPETLACSPLDFAETCAAGPGRIKRESIADTDSVRGECPTMSPTIANCVAKDKPSPGDARSDGMKSSSNSFAFPAVSLSSWASSVPGTNGQDDEEDAVVPSSVDATYSKTDAPHFESAPRWRGRPVPFEIKTNKPASFTEVLGAPKRSDSPRMLDWRRSGTHAGEIRGRGCNTSAEEGFTRIEPLRPHSV